MGLAETMGSAEAMRPAEAMVYQARCELLVGWNRTVDEGLLWCSGDEHLGVGEVCRGVQRSI